MAITAIIEKWAGGKVSLSSWLHFQLHFHNEIYTKFAQVKGRLTMNEKMSKPRPN